MGAGGVLSLNPAQQGVVDRGLLDLGLDVVLELATGAGKTWLARMATAREVEAGRRVVVLVPLRALSEELARGWGDLPGVLSSHGGAPRVPGPDVRVLVATPERVGTLLRRWRRHAAWLAEVGLIVADELHLLGTPVRGPRLEGVLLRLRRLCPLARTLGLTATAGDRHELAAWLGGVAWGSPWRPLPLRWTERTWSRAADKPGILRQVVAGCVRGGGRSLVFVQSRRRAEDLAALLAADGLRARAHHAGLVGASREQVEALLRARDLDVVVATGTLEMGVNLPVRQVVLYDMQRLEGASFGPLERWRVAQRAGRAGRPGLDVAGEVVVLRPRWHRAPWDPREGTERVLSGLADPAALAEQVLVEIGTGLCRTEAQLARALAGTLAAHQGRLPPLGPILASLREAGLLDGLRPTREARVALRQHLPPHAVGPLLRHTRDPEPTSLDLLLVALCVDPGLPVNQEELPDLGRALSGHPTRLLAAPPADLGEGRALLRRLKAAVVLLDPDREWGVYPGELAALRERVARSLAAIGALRPGLRGRCAALGARAAHGLSAEAASLTQVPGIGGVLARRLVAAGVPDVEALAEADPAALMEVRGVSSGRAVAWVEAASGRSAWAFTDSGVAVTPVVSWPAGVDPYRLRRARDLVVEGEGPWTVRGGLEPHRVADGVCDCADFASGNQCKHVLAVKLCGDPSLVTLGAGRGDGLDLGTLWTTTVPRGTGTPGARRGGEPVTVDAWPRWVPVSSLGAHPLDALALPYLELLAPAVMVSLPYLEEAAVDPPRLPLWVDSGSFAVLAGGSVREEDGLGHVVRPGGQVLTPRHVLEAQEARAAVGFTLDLPAPDALSAEQCRVRLDLTVANARWAAANRRRRDLVLLGVVQGWDAASYRECAERVAELGLDGLAIGGLVPRARRWDRVVEIVEAVRAVADGPLHVLGLGAPERAAALYALGVSSVDTSGWAREAVRGRSWTGLRVEDPSPTERLRLALLNLAVGTGERLPLAALLR